MEQQNIQNNFLSSACIAVGASGIGLGPLGVIAIMRNWGRWQVLCSTVIGGTVSAFAGGIFGGVIGSMVMPGYYNRFSPVLDPSGAGAGFLIGAAAGSLYAGVDTGIGALAKKIANRVNSDRTSIGIGVVASWFVPHPLARLAVAGCVAGALAKNSPDQ
jgi:hypothetical protein